MKKLTFIIPYFNQIKETNKCLKNLSRIKIKNLCQKIILVDNGSKEKILLNRQKLPFQINIIKNKKNLGFAKATNQGIREALKDKADYIFLLNNDTLLNQEAFSSLIEEIKKSKKIGIIGPAIKFKKGKKILFDLGGKVDWLLGTTRHKELSFGQFKKTKKEPIFPGYISGCAMLIKKEVFEKIGFFDEDFFLYFEDIDFCIRAKKAGFRVCLLPKAIIFHKLSKSLTKNLKARYNFLSNLIFIKKHLTWYKRPIAFCYQFLRWQFLQLF